MEKEIDYVSDEFLPFLIKISYSFILTKEIHKFYFSFLFLFEYKISCKFKKFDCLIKKIHIAFIHVFYLNSDRCRFQFDVK